MFPELVDGKDLRDKIIARINNFDSTKTDYELNSFIEQFNDFINLVEWKAVGQSRWGVTYRSVYSVAMNDETTDVQFFAVTYSVGATELQDDHPVSQIAKAVTPKQVVSTQYV